jgi:squalene-hopene cyclase-like protein
MAALAASNTMTNSIRGPLCNAQTLNRKGFAPGKKSNQRFAMHSGSIAVLAITLALSSVQAADKPAKEPDEQEAVRRGLAYVEGKSMAWLRQRKCASCHHVPMMVWAQRDARLRGFKIDDKAMQEATDFLLAADNRGNVVPSPAEPERPGNPFSLMSAYTILAFRDGGKSPEPAAQEIMKKAAAHVLAKQQADGSWKRFEGRAPIMDLQEPATLLAAHVLDPQPKAGSDAAAKAARLREWLTANSKGESQTALSWRIMLGHERKASVELLLKRQNADGGWSQVKEMASDAYATGQAMYALLSRGGVDRNAPAIIKARDFLLKTQKPDGSWAMTSRPPNNGAGKTGAGNLEPITVAGSAWAVLGLLQRLPVRAP